MVVVQHDRVELLVVILICFCGPAFTVLVVQESILRYRKYLLMQFGYVPAHVESVRTPGSIVGSRVRAFYGTRGAAPAISTLQANGADETDPREKAG